MSEEVYKITNMLVTDEDIIDIDKNWQSIVDEYLKVYVREKDQVIAQYIMKKQNEEIERLNNIINEIEKMFNHEILIKYYYGMSYEFEINDFKDDILKIIKGSDKE